MFKFNWMAAALFCLCRAINNDIYETGFIYLLGRLPREQSSYLLTPERQQKYISPRIKIPEMFARFLFWFSITMDKRCKTSNTFGTHPIKILTLNTRPESRIPLLLPLLGRVICNGNAVQHSHTSQSLLGLLTLTRHNCLPLGHLRNLPWIPSPWIWLKIKQS